MLPASTSYAEMQSQLLQAAPAGAGDKPASPEYQGLLQQTVQLADQAGTPGQSPVVTQMVGQVGGCHRAGLCRHAMETIQVVPAYMH